MASEPQNDRWTKQQHIRSDNPHFINVIWLSGNSIVCCLSDCDVLGTDILFSSLGSSGHILSSNSPCLNSAIKRDIISIKLLHCCITLKRCSLGQCTVSHETPGFSCPYGDIVASSFVWSLSGGISSQIEKCLCTQRLDACLFPMANLHCRWTIGNMKFLLSKQSV